MQRIALFGGSFDPIHLGHLEIIRSVDAYLGADKILVMPCGNPPHRDEAMASPEQRLKMLQIACNAFPSVEIDDSELRSKALSYTHSSLERLRQKYPEALIFLVLGGDSLASFTTWHRWQDILAVACLVVAARGDEKLLANEELLERLGRVIERGSEAEMAAAGDLLELPFQRMDISSTDLRQCFSRGADTADLVLPEIAEYIKENELYRS